jgi:hypothetical protein
MRSSRQFGHTELILRNRVVALQISNDQADRATCHVLMNALWTPGAVNRPRDQQRSVL